MSGLKRFNRHLYQRYDSRVGLVIFKGISGSSEFLLLFPEIDNDQKGLEQK